jgi:hypothetical protein
MTIQIELRPDEVRELRELARASGGDISEYVHRVLTEHIRFRRGPQTAAKSFDEVLSFDAGLARLGRTPGRVGADWCAGPDRPSSG